jgi:hypothetical protein
MSNDIKNKINDALYNFYLEADKETINDSLKSDIQNLDEYNNKKKQIIFLAKAKAKQQQNDYLKELVSKFQEAINKNIEKPVAVLKQLIQSNPSFASVGLYLNLDKLSKEDIIEIIKDKNLVELLEQLEENDKNN